MWEIWVQSLGREDPLEKGMATHASALAWRIPWKEEPSGLQSMGSQRVGHDWVTFTVLENFTCQWMAPIYIGLPGAQMIKNLPAMQETQIWFDPRVGKIPWRKEWLLTPVFLSGEFHGQWSLVKCTVYLGIHSLCLIVWQVLIMLCIHHYHIMQNSFTTLKISCVVPMQPALFPLVSIVLFFSRMS